jgi:glycosyltransferase involved in cell wall biosynthesis
MRICVISTTIFACPPPGYSGLEFLAWQQAEGLKAKGHQVMLVAPHGSQTSCELHGTTLRESEKQAYSGYWHKLPNFDVIIDSTWEKWSYMLKIEGKLKAPILGVLHAPVNTMYNTPPPVPKPCLVAISQDQSNAIKEHLKVDSRVCYNGIDTDFYKPTGQKRTNRYLFLARISSIKGPDIACDVAEKCKVGLDIVGDDTITGEPDLLRYVKTKCNLCPYLQYVGPQVREQCAIWFNINKALLHPNVRFKEPFGLAPVEANSCEMPVICFDHGAMRETIKHGETGFLVNTQEQMEELIKTDAISSIKRDRCREWSLQFSYDNMINRYEKLCKEAINGGW